MNLEKFLNEIANKYSYESTNKLEYLERDINDYCNINDIIVTREDNIKTKDLKYEDFSYEMPYKKIKNYYFLERNGRKSKFSFDFMI